MATLSIGLYLLLEGAIPTAILYPMRRELNRVAYTFNPLGPCGMLPLEVSKQRKKERAHELCG